MTHMYTMEAHISEFAGVKMKREEFGTRLLTRVYANTQLQLMFWQMTYTKHRHVTKELQSHTCYLTRMLDTIQHGAAADNYVCIANRLHLLKHLNHYWVYCFGQ